VFILDIRSTQDFDGATPLDHNWIYGRRKTNGVNGGHGMGRVTEEGREVK